MARADYPDRPVRLFVPFPAGGATDAAAREIGEALARSLGKPVVVEDRPGADGAIAAKVVMESPPDGYTLLFASSSMEGVPFELRDPPFRSLADFTPVSLVCRLTFGIVTPASFAVGSIRELVAYARAHPGEVDFGSGSLSEELAAAQFMGTTGIRMQKIPYLGGFQMIPDLLSGRVKVSFGPLTPLIPLVRKGQLRALAVLADGRIPVLPSTPSLGEAGVAGVSGAGGLQAIVGPPGLPPSIVARLNKAVREAVADPSIRARFEERAQVPEASTPEALIAMIHGEHSSWERFASVVDVRRQ
jgi:tripartite-type tricarboxylate transporter receptor subunit TctC